MNQVFDTVRLRVFAAEFAPTARNVKRRVFLAFRTDEDRPLVCATAVVLENSVLGPYLDWIEVTTEYRRDGLGAEFLLQLIGHYDGRLLADPVTPEGEALCAKLFGNGDA